MSDFKSKLPDLKELGEMTGKLFKDIRNSVTEIINDYKKNHGDVVESVKKPTAEAQKPKEEKPKAVKPKAKTKDKKEA
ncbi:MAG: hypothetical protein NTW94_04200 [Legionellales bacterium]|nr:hypothetical protein [Legionellales bacterium]